MTQSPPHSLGMFSCCVRMLCKYLFEDSITHPRDLDMSVEVVITLNHIILPLLCLPFWL